MPGASRRLRLVTPARARWTLPFFCPLTAAKAGKARQSPAKGETEKRPDSAGADARSGKGQQRAAKRGSRRFFRLLTGGLLVRIQPEEPIFSIT
jgi:hypothetical protein